MKRALAALAALCLASCSSGGPFGHRPVTGAWRLIPAESSIRFVGVKNNAVAVPGSFAGMEGGFDADQHTGWVEVRVGTAETGNPARDENIRTHFFEAAKFPTARLEVRGLPASDALPPEGASAAFELNASLELHGATQALKIPVRVAREHEKLRLHNSTPLVLSAHDLGMDAQLAALKAVCGHEALSGAIPLELELVFAPAGASGE
jgi:polyisoprenoid-binding protein YceI